MLIRMLKNKIEKRKNALENTNGQNTSEFEFLSSLIVLITDYEEL